MKKKIFLRVFLVMLLTVFLVFGAGLFAVYQNSKNITANRLKVEAELLSFTIKTYEDIDQMYHYINRDEFRITVIRENGEVLYESSMYGVPEENHASREEVVAALSGTPHTAERYSETFRCNMTYYAIRSTLKDGSVIVIRLAVRSSEIVSYLTFTVPFLVIILCLSIIISLVLANRLSHYISGKIGDIGESLHSLNTGVYKPIKIEDRESELNSILCQINDLNAKTHKHIQAEINEKQKFSIVLDNISEGIIALDKENRIVFANHSAFKIFDGNKDSIKQDVTYLISNRLSEKLIEIVDDISSFEYSEKGCEYLVTVRKILNVVPDSEVFLIIVLNDITKEKNISREKSDFFANTSHELKTPITVMQGHSELLLSKGTLSENEAKQVQRIYKECIRLSDLISDMLKLSNLERKEQELVNVDVNLLNVSEEVVAELDKLICEKNIAVSISGNAVIKADPKKIYELISNLCTNAVKYNKENGSIDIKITEENDKVVLLVSDTGIGIEKEHIPRLCERFYRVDKSRSKKTGGTGLGLAIVKYICALYDAKLSIDSEIDVGTNVTVYFKK